MLYRESLITPLLSLETSLLVALLLKLLQYLHLLLQSDVGSSYIHPPSVLSFRSNMRTWTSNAQKVN